MRPSINISHDLNPDTARLSSLRRHELIGLHAELAERVTALFPAAQNILAGSGALSARLKKTRVRTSRTDDTHEGDDLLDVNSLAKKLGLSVWTIRAAISTGRIEVRAHTQKKGPKQQLISVSEARRVFASTLRNPSVSSLPKEERAAGLMSFEEIAEETGLRLEQIQYAARLNRFPGFRKGRKLFARLSDAEAALLPDRLQPLCQRKILQAEIRIMQLWLAHAGQRES